MDKIIDIKEKLKHQDEAAEKKPCPPKAKVTNPIFKKLAAFSNEKLTKKFDINDILK